MALLVRKIKMAGSKLNLTFVQIRIFSISCDVISFIVKKLTPATTLHDQ